MQTVKCLRCDHESPSELPLAASVFRCDECGARMAFGELAPSVVVAPDETKRFVVIRIGDDVGNQAQFKLDAQHAAAFAINILSLVKP